MLAALSSAVAAGRAQRLRAPGYQGLGHRDRVGAHVSLTESDPEPQSYLGAAKRAASGGTSKATCFPASQLFAAQIPLAVPHLLQNLLEVRVLLVRGCVQ